MKRYNHRTTLTAVLATALLLAACAKNEISGDVPPIPAGMGELTLGELQLSGNDLPLGGLTPEPAIADTTPASTADTTRATAATPATGATRAATATKLPAGATLRLYAFEKGETDFGTKLATRTYTIDAAGTPLLDAGQDPLYLPAGEVDIYLAGPVRHDFGTTDNPQVEEIASEYDIYPRIGVDLVAAYATSTVTIGHSNPLPAMTLTHKMALVQVVVEATENAVFENLNVKEVKLFDQPLAGSYTLNSDGGIVTPGTAVSEFVCPLINEETPKIRFSATTVLMPQPSKEFKIETTFECNQKNMDASDNHPTLKYRQSGLVTEPLAAATATRFTAQPMIPVEIKWRTKVLPWNDVVQDGITIPGGITPTNPVTPPTQDQWVEIDGLKWTTGNLVAKNTHQCMVGDPSDYGVYFQFGSLVGWTGGADGNGTGQGSQTADKRVWPIEMGRTKPTYSWQNNNAANIGTLKHYYFNYSANGWDTEGRDLRDFDEPIDGDAGTGTLASGRYAKQGVGDPCTYYLGDPWRLPTQAEIFALKERGYGGWQQYVGANGRWFGPGNAAGDAATAIFLPAAGHRYPSSSNNWQIGGEGRYGTTTIVSATQHNYMFINYGSVKSPDKSSRSGGLTARCVSGTYVKPVTPIDYTATPANSYVTYPKDGAMQTVKFNALKKPVAKYGAGNTTPVNTTGENPSTADAGLEKDIAYQSGDKIEVSWQTAVGHAATGDMVIKSISLGTDGVATVEVNGVGNALLSYKRESTILWNYHIWATDSDPFATHYPTGSNVNGTAEGGAAAKFMDRNLGALAATAAKPAKADAYKYFGVTYQHGRPTPFSGQGAGEAVKTYTKIFDGSGAEITSSIGGYTQNTTAVSTVTSAVQTPNTYYYQSLNSYYSWFSVNISLWSDYGTNKSIYDPCPYGYRVPINGSWSSWTSHTQIWTNDDINGGVVNNSWWPATGQRNHIGGDITDVGRYGYCWSSTRHPSFSYYSHYLYFGYSGTVNPSNATTRSRGMSVRCVQEGY